MRNLTEVLAEVETILKNIQETTKAMHTRTQARIALNLIAETRGHKRDLRIVDHDLLAFIRSRNLATFAHSERLATALRVHTLTNSCTIAEIDLSDLYKMTEGICVGGKPNNTYELAEAIKHAAQKGLIK